MVLFIFVLLLRASGVPFKETGSEDDGLADLSDDDFFVSGTSNDEADADDELTDISAREQASSASGHFGKAASGLSSDERNQKQKSARYLMPPPYPQKSITRRNITPKNTTNHRNFNSYNGESSNSQTGQSSNMSSNSDAPKPRRKRRTKKKKQLS